MSPILVRPVREQLEHDRVIRLLQAKYKRKFEVGINPGNEQAVPVGVGTAAWFPDLVLLSQDRSHKLQGVVEVETAESVNNLEAMSQWVAFSRLRVQFHLYVPQSMIDPARRLCADLQIPVGEIWMYHLIGDQMRFTLVQKTATPEPKTRPAVAAAVVAAPAPPRPAAPARPRAAAAPVRPEPAARSSRATAARPARRAAPAPAPTAARRKAKATKTKSVVARKKTSGTSRSRKRK